MTDLRTFDQISPTDVDAVGGKGLSLGLMASAGLPVPPGFCVTSAAYRRGKALPEQPDLANAVRAAYQALGGGPVAVRSSATAEDGAEVSFAGQQETFLGVVGEDAVCDAVARCWASLGSERAVAYRRKQGVADDGLAMAVVVQRLAPAEVAGVLFTRDPLDAAGRQMLVEASWGLGESVVSGRVQPDRFHLDRDSGAVLDRHISSKKEEVTAAGVRPVPAERQDAPCLDDARLAELAELGRRIEAFYQGPRDVEWAWGEGKFWLLQARPITAAGAAEREQVRQAEIAALAQRAESGGTVWSRYSLSEVLPAPTPMSWAVVRRLMSGRGGCGLLYRDLGFDPDPSLDDDGVFDLVCGRPYCNLSREPRQLYRTIPFVHHFKKLKADPQSAFYPAPAVDYRRLSWSFWALCPVLWPWMLYRISNTQSKGRKLAESFPARFRTEIAPAFRRETRAEAEVDYARLDAAALLHKLEHWTQRTLHDFARDSLKPTALAQQLIGRVELELTPRLGAERSREGVRSLMMGARAEPQSDLAGAVRDLASGKMDRARFLELFGHRGRDEMELAQPRWGEDPSTLEQTAAGPAVAAEHESARQAFARLAAAARLTGAERRDLRATLHLLHTHLGLRETAKHYLMYGYALIRRALVELDRRGKLNGGVFYLTPEELPRLVKGEDVAGIIAKRKQRRLLALSLEAPPVLFSDDLEAIGRPAPLADNAELLQGIPLSAGVAEAPALVLEKPHAETLPAGGYILVCPSTDPAWVPLFMQAKGLVMESGGVLSHGAIVAREFGLPAAAGLSGVTRRLRTGQRLRVDGNRGTVTVLAG
jgi:pyruvate,water dikinase